MSQHRKKNGIPDRWLDYLAVGKRLHGTRFIAFKVPLKQSLTRSLSARDAFGPWELLDAMEKENQELGLIIDLTFTKRYYKLQDLPESLLCVKIFTRGHEVPGDDTILSFKQAVRNFLRNNADNDKLIGVHCTHGLNRTGYLICRYLIDVDGMDPVEAVQLFNSSRGHHIERQNYLDDLQRGPKRSNEGMDESGQEPMRGLASHRPEQVDWGDDRGPHDDPRLHRTFPFPGERIHRPPSNGLLPDPPMFPRLPFHPPMGAHFHPYRWPPLPPHHPPWRRPAHFPESRSGFPPEHRERRSSSRWQEDRRRAPPPPNALPRYSPRWADEPARHEGAKEEAWEPQRDRREHRQTHRDREHQRRDY